jgi:hypothetical protein
LPHPVNECFNGYCSIDALNLELKEKNMVKEHLYPRKRAGKDVLENDYLLTEFYIKVKEQYRIFMYLTSEENKLTINYEGSHDDELNRLNIRKFPIADPSPFEKKHTRFKKFISWLKPQLPKEKKVTIEEAEKYLEEFLKL